MAALAFMVGIVFLGTAGVDFVVNGNPRGATGFVIGIVSILVAAHQWYRARQLENRI